jgi:parallel beta-helix repeat protein
MANHFCRNQYEGINLYHSDSNTLTNNNFSTNGHYGIYLEGFMTIKNRVHQNNFINNNGADSIYDPLHIQAKDSSGMNFWNSSYPSGGNYWSDWTSPDIKSGPHQNLSGSDGIVDSPYLIDGGKGAQDYYPLTTKVIIPEITPGPLIVVSVLLIVAIAVNRRKQLP